MTWGFTQNAAPATWAEAVYNIKEELKTAGWTVPMSSDGTTYNSGGDQISSGGSGANGMDNASAWFRIQDPGGTRELTFQRNSSTGANTSRSFRIKYSYSAKFTGGSPGATQTPSATDEQLVIGAGTDAAPTFVQWQSATDGSYWQNVGADNAAEYGWYNFCVATGLGYTTKGGGFMFDPIVNGSGTPATDPDPLVIYITLNGDTYSGTNGPWSFVFSTSTATHAPLNGYAETSGSKIYGYAGSTWVKYTAAILVTMTNGAIGYVGNQGVSETRDANDTSKDVSMPLIYLRHSAVSNSAWKGFSSVARMFIYQVSARAQLSLASINTTGDYVVVGVEGTASAGRVLLPWDNSAISG